MGIESFNSQEQQDRARALAYFERLRGEQRVEVPQDSRCEISIVIPAYNEDPQSISRLLESLTKQKGIEPEQFEVIIVLNNGPKADLGVRQNNQLVLDMPIWANRPVGDISHLSDAEKRRIEEIRQRFKFFAIDKSSKGNEIEDCNVGKARNRGVAEASLRFFERGKNGIIFQTDADSRLLDEHFFEKTISVFGDRDMIAAGGDIDYEPDLSQPDARESGFNARSQKELIMLKFIKRMHQFNPKKTEGRKKGFAGGNMLSRSFETAVIGGLKDRAAGEDTVFGQQLNEFAQERGKKVTREEQLRVTTVLRESGRTPVPYKRFMKGGYGQQKFVEDPRTIDSVFFKKHRPVPLEEAYRIMRERLAATEEGRAFLEKLDRKMKEEFPGFEGFEK